MKITFDSRYLAKGDLPDDGDAIFTILDCDRRTVGQGEDAEEKFVLQFQETKKAMILNKTNLKTLIKIMGSDDTDDWTNRKVAVWFNPDVEMGGEIIGG